MTVKVVTWNLRYFGAEKDLPPKVWRQSFTRYSTFARLIQPHLTDTDIFCFQEVSDISFLKSLLADLGVNAKLYAISSDTNRQATVTVIRGEWNRIRSYEVDIDTMMAVFNRKPDSSLINQLDVPPSVKTDLLNRVSFQAYAEAKFGSSHPMLNELVAKARNISFGRNILIVEGTLRKGNEVKTVSIINLHLKSNIHQHSLFPDKYNRNSPSANPPGIIEFFNNLNELCREIYAEYISEYSTTVNHPIIVAGDFNTVHSYPFSETVGETTFSKLTDAGFQGTGNSLSAQGLTTYLSPANASLKLDFDHILVKGGTINSATVIHQDTQRTPVIFNPDSRYKRGDIVLATYTRGQDELIGLYRVNSDFHPRVTKVVTLGKSRVLTKVRTSPNESTVTVILPESHTFQVLEETSNQLTVYPLGDLLKKPYLEATSYTVQRIETDQIRVANLGGQITFTQLVDDGIFTPLVKPLELNKEYLPGDMVLIPNKRSPYAGIWICKEPHISATETIESNEGYRVLYWRLWCTAKQLQETYNSLTFDLVSDHNAVVAEVTLSG